jgi:spore coat polysaccharide biosynthesis protein SpsF (cytidylyltransferase family)/aryl-alcohol dehydrogenase-like predicted oxidoreductase
MPSWRVVVQSRISSTRLPAKALLPLNGFPIAALCALRAGNCGGDVVLATSCQPEDDVLVQALSSYDIQIFRGALDNVLDRFVRATEDLDEENIVVRLTADNVFPDGQFVDSLVQQFIAENVDYLGTNSPLDGLPYGLSAEVFSVRILRQAALHATSNAEREHVTPWIRKNGICVYTDASKFGLDRRYCYLRATVDNLNDYLRTAKLFGSINVDPVRVCWKKLLEALADASDTLKVQVPYRVDSEGRVNGILSLGTAQLGMRYGRANISGQPSVVDAERIIHAALDYGITDIDTARAYGASERRIGQALRSGMQGRARVITKLDPLTALMDSASRQEIEFAVDASVFRSCYELNVPRLDVLMVHRWMHRYQYNDAIWNRLVQLRNDGIIANLGASVSTPDEAIAALQDPNVKHIQLPCNLLDWRWEQPEFLSAVAQRTDVDIHVRSAFLQGILLASQDVWPTGFVDNAMYVSRIDRLVVDLKRESRADLCLAFLTGTEWISSVLVGVETELQLIANIQLARRPALTQEEKRYVREILGCAPITLLNPAAWVA